MTRFGSSVTIGLVGTGLLALVACSGEPDSRESSASTDELRRGGRSHDARRRPRHRHTDRGHHHHHGPDCGHGRGGGGGSSETGGSSAGGSSGSGASSSGGSGGTSTGGVAGTAGTGTGGSPDPGVCGDGLVSYLEQCDDANVTAGDGCDAACVIEPGFTCELGGACREVVCGDSLQDVYAVGDGVFEFEACDDGNANSGDGCDAACDLEVGFVCPGPGLPCREVVCGDGFQDGYFVPGDGGTGGSGGSGGVATGGVATGGGSTGGFAGTGGSAGAGGYGTWIFETCDDGNVASGDGCSATCAVEDGFVCDRPGEPCREPRCGDGFVDFIPGTGGTGGTGGSGSGGTGTGGIAGGGGGGTFEECDDGNATGSDGCGASCTLEPGFACPEPGAPCRAIVCGDGFADWPDEECDDGNDVSDDGCTDCAFDGSGGIGGTGGTGGGVTGGSAGTAGVGGG